jgi:hypothetical protein
MSDDRWNSDDERAPYLDRAPRQRPRFNVRPAANQPDRRGPPTPEEIEAFVAQEFGGSKEQQKKRLVRPEGWDDFIGPIQQQQTVRGDAYEGDEP